MPSILKREFAPISDEAWAALDEEAARFLRANLTARKLVDFTGPNGWEFGALNLGRLRDTQQQGEIHWGVREVKPLTEIRTFFTLGQFEVDNLTRGKPDVDLEPLQKATVQAARFEDAAVFNGFEGGGITGLAQASEHDPVALPGDPSEYPAAVSAAMKALRSASVDGPCDLVLSPDAYYDLMGAARTGYPPHRVVAEMIGGDIHVSEALTGGLLVSTRGGDAELAVGTDFSIGYTDHDRHNVEFFLTESFTFRVIDPAAVVVLNA